MTVAASVPKESPSHKVARAKPQPRVFWTIRAKEPVSSAAFSPDSRSVAFGTGFYTGTTPLVSNGNAQLWDIATRKRKRTLYDPHAEFVTSVTFSADGRTLGTTQFNNAATLWDVATGKIKRKLPHPSNIVRSISFAPDGKTMVSSSDASIKGESNLQFWDAKSGRLLHKVVDPHTGWAFDAAFSPNGRTIASNWYDDSQHEGQIRFYDARTAKLTRATELYPMLPLAAAFSPDGTLIAGSFCAENQRSGEIRLYDVQTAQLVRVIGAKGPCPLSIAFSPDGKTIAVGSDDHLIRLWSVRTGYLHYALTGHRHWVHSVAFSPDGHLLASGSRDKTLMLWRLP